MMEKDWRLNGQEAYLSHAALCKVTFPEFWETSLSSRNRFYEKIARGPITYIKGPDGNYVRVENNPLPISEAAAQWHEHCDFCWDKATVHSACAFYCTDDLRHWVCETCFHDFNDAFGWTIISPDEFLL